MSVAQAQNKVIQGVSKTSPKIKAEKVVDPCLTVFVDLRRYCDTLQVE